MTRRSSWHCGAAWLAVLASLLSAAPALARDSDEHILRPVRSRAVHASPGDPSAALDERMLVQMKRTTVDMMWAQIDPERQELPEGGKPYEAAP
ncbi:MAG: hypothetical protein EXR79_17285 [Myxococcales bacterium]|nr:hypothetical protein [Myxococcales bacterium]